MPGHGPACFSKDIAGRHAGRRELIADLVVELEHRKMGLRDQKILVVAVIADQRKPLGAARQIVARGGGYIAERHADSFADEEFRAGGLPVAVAGIARVKLPAAIWTEAIYAVQI